MANYTSNELKGFGTSSMNLTAGISSSFEIHTNTSQSYFTLETTRNSSGSYDLDSPKNISGSFTNFVNIKNAVSQSDYIAGFVLGVGTSSFNFTPANNITGDSLMLRGCGSIYLVIS